MSSVKKYYRIGRGSFEITFDSFYYRNPVKATFTLWNHQYQLLHNEETLGNNQREYLRKLREAKRI